MHWGRLEEMRRRQRFTVNFAMPVLIGGVDGDRFVTYGRRGVHTQVCLYYMAAFHHILRNRERMKRVRTACGLPPRTIYTF